MSDGCVAVLGRAENGVMSVETANSVAAGTEFALVAARSGGVVEIDAARPLEDVASDGRHVADLRRGARQQRPRQHRIMRPHGRMRGDHTVAEGRADQ
jgi:hypothetical protein